MNPWLLPAGIVTPEAAPPHSQCYNILFGDGHVVSVKRRDYLFPPRTAQNWNKDNQPHPEAWAPKTQWAV
jgi:prepilin-type processing-associated H-X9-DG protein